MRGNSLLKIAPIVLIIGTVAGCGGAAVVGSATVSPSLRPPITTTSNPSASARYCQRLPNGQWVTNDSAYSTTPCVPDPAYATGDEQVDGSVAIPRCFACSLSDWDRAEKRAEARIASVDTTAANTTTAGSLPEEIAGSFSQACDQNADECECVERQVAKQVSPNQMGALTADDPRVQAALQNC
jgi:hypothetical protein